MQQQSLSDSPLFVDLAHRKQNENELDDILSTWTRGHSREDVVTTLQAAGVPSGPVETCADLRGDPQLEARGFFVTNDHPTLGPFAYEGFEYIMSETTGEIENSPLMGQHTHAVLKNILELSDSAIADLASTGALE
jgi:crotonobetainyl-CoA:carnitine CoA-transferase CaiB-like acyl-CoA transferase